MEKERQSHGGTREENVGGDVEFVGDVEGVGAELVDDEGDDVVGSGRRHGFEEISERREGAGDGEDD